MKNNDLSEVMIDLMPLVYPFMILYGIYMILNGYNTPGGGFQGGAILSTVLISRYFIFDRKEYNIDLIYNLEKIFYLLLVIIASVIILGFRLPDTLNELYQISLNIIIGFKVFCGLSIIFLRFVNYESR